MAHRFATVDLPVREPLDADELLRFLAARAIAGVEIVTRTDTGWRYARTLTLAHGPGAVQVQARSVGDRWRLRTDLELTDPADADAALARVRRLLDLDADPVAVDTALAGDPVLAPLVDAHRGIRVPGTVDPHELVVRAMVGQQISVAAARTHLGRLTAAVGTPHVSQFEGLRYLFPTAAQLARGLCGDAAPEGARSDYPHSGDPRSDDPRSDHPYRPLRLPTRAVRAITSVAQRLAEGELRVAVDADPAQLRDALLAQPGIGPWTAGYVAMRVLGDPDVWLPGDVALLAGAQRLGVIPAELPRPAAHRMLAEHAERWAPWRSYAVMHLWRVAAG